MRILLVTDSYPPEIRSASHLMKELAEELRDRGYEICVATCYPAYNLTDSSLKKKYQEYCIEDGIEVIRIKTLPHHKVNFIVRGISQLTLPHIFWRKIKKYFRKAIDSVVVYSPPLPLGYVGWWCKKHKGAKFILNLQDIFPQNAIDLGVIKNKFIISYFERVERAIYEFADVITVHSEGNKKFLIENKEVDEKKIQVLHNWIDVRAYETFEQDGFFRKKLNLEDKFIFFFGGVIGPSQGLDMVLDAAKKVSNHDEIILLIAGDGTEKQKLVEKAKAENLKNVLFHPFLEKDEYVKLLKEIDVGLVSLSIKNKTPVVPSKILDYMAAGIPVLGFLNKESDGHSIIKMAGCGYSVISDDSTKLADLMLRMYSEKHLLKKMGYNGYRYALENFSKEICVNKIEVLIKR